MKFHLLLVLGVVGIISAATAKSHHGRPHQHGHGVVTPKPSSEGVLSSNHQTEDQQKSHHETTNRISPTNIRRGEKFSSPKKEEHLGVTPQVPQASPTPSLKRASNKENNNIRLLHSTAHEHNINKKQLENDTDGIPMETEFLIHVTPKPPTIRKLKKGSQGSKRRAQFQGSSKLTPNDRVGEGKLRKGTKGQSQHATKLQQQHRPGKDRLQQQNQSKKVTKGKGRRYPKKYNPQKHNLKKNLKEKKTFEKNKERRDKLKEKREKRKKLKTTHKAKDNSM